MKKYLIGRENLDFSLGFYIIFFFRDKVFIFDWLVFFVDDFLVVSNKIESINNKWL